jgi:N-acylneuraminate cytidylyltransferase
MAPVLRHALAEVEAAEGDPYDLVLLLDPTSPAREPAEIESAIARLLAHPEWDGVVSVSAPTFHPVWVGVRESVGEPGRPERYFADGTGITRRQELDRYLRINGTFYVWRADFVRRLESSWMDEGVHGLYEIPEARAFAIDYLEEFEVLEALVGAGVVRLPGITPSA